MAHILVVEDDRFIRDFLVKGLKELGHTVEQCDNVLDATGKMDKSIDLAIVDIMLKDGGNGLQLIKLWRDEKINAPIIILSARDRVEDKIQGLTNGADDYMTKPFSFIELKARVENLLRRMGKRAETTVYIYEDLSLDLLKREVYREGKSILLQRREFMMLEYFLENPEQVLGKTMILERIWGFDFDPQTNVVDVLISRLRSKIDKGFDRQLIHTIRGVGYVLKAA